MPIIPCSALNCLGIWDAAATDSLVLDTAQQQGLNTSLATIVGNYLSHWSTGQTHAFTPNMLKGVMQAIDEFAACFQFEHPSGSGEFRYYAALDKKLSRR